jgi:hypothetical protein
VTNFKPHKQDKDPKHLQAVRGLPCCICEAFGQTQTSETTAHHTICGRYSGAKTPDREAIHSGKESWEAEYGPDTDYIAATLDKIERDYQ